MLPPDIQELMQSAVQCHQTGDLRQAETIYRKILKKQPGNFDILHMLGVLYAQMEAKDLAIKYIEKALRINPKNAFAHYNLGNTFRDSGRFERAEACYRSVMRLHRNDDKNCNGLGGDLKEMGRPNGDIKSGTEATKKSILISVAVFNRKTITGLSLAQTKRYKTPYCHLQVYNDHSTEFDNSFLAHYADEVIQLPVKKGIHDLRWHQFRKFLETDFDFIYMTDSDVLHDPGYVTVLEKLYEWGDRKFPVCLFNSAFHMDPRTILCRKNGILLKGTAPGVSMFYSKKMVEKIVSMLFKHHDTSIWDYTALKYLGLPWITPETSYLEHYGGGGIHNADYERDRAINPTKYLVERRTSILDHLLRGDKLDVFF
jgi:tetratricopeptide (TPR) repeat protein